MRIRSIKPAFWSSRTVAKLGPWERLLFVGLWNYVDDEGRERADAHLLRLAIFPFEEFEDEDVAKMLDRLHRVGLVTLYRRVPRRSARSRQTVAGSRQTSAGRAVDLVQVEGWSEHQRIDRPRESLYPAPQKRGSQRRRILGDRSSKARRAVPVGSGSGRDKEVEVEDARGVVDPNQLGLFDPTPDDPSDPASPAVEENGSKRPIPFAERPNPWADLDPIE